MEFINLISNFVFGYIIIVVLNFAFQMITPILFLPFKLLMSEEKYMNFWKASISLIYIIVITRYMEYTIVTYENFSLINRLLLFIVIGSFMYFFFADKLNTANKKVLLGKQLKIQSNLFFIESIFVNMKILYLLVVCIFGVSIPIINLDYFFNLIPDNKIVKYGFLLFFLIVYFKYFIALIISGFFTLSNIKNLLFGRFGNHEN